MEIKSTVREYISGFIKGHEVRDDEDMFAAGYVNSLFAMQLVLFIEKEFAITIESDEMVFTNFKSVNAISDFVCAKSPAGVLS